MKTLPHLLLAACVAACGSGKPDSTHPGDGQDTVDVPADGSWDAPGDVPADGPADTHHELADPGDPCIPPHALIILDRTMSMHRETGGTPKWTVALDAIALMMSTYPETIWWGLELFPRDHDSCVTLEERIAGTTASNPRCEEGEVVVDPGPSTSDAINTRLGDTLLCRSTPVELAVDVAVAWFEAHPPDIPDRKQVAIIITDGRETCDGRAECPIATLYSMGIKTFVLGFGEEVDPHDLSSMACAGGTASDMDLCDFTDPDCPVAASGATDLFHFAEDPESFETALDEIAALIECGGLI
jgi:hypothetical protein